MMIVFRGKRETEPLKPVKIKITSDFHDDVFQGPDDSHHDDPQGAISHQSQDHHCQAFPGK